ncbi:hypothetical protein NKH84_26450 [Mesorhizobium sp. M0902]|uniref:hypothetical protein n=1 Tax=Mesorhizobium sp. M0902 TaxID=2957021 RepID=UPI00333C1A6B
MIGNDAESPVCTGSGRIVITSFTTIEYRMYAKPSAGAFKRLAQMASDPYDGGKRLRLFATDMQGTKWIGGWTSPRLGEAKTGIWDLGGELQSLMTGVSGPWVSKESGVELVFLPEIDLPMDRPMVTTTTLDGVEIESSLRFGKHTVSVLGSEIDFFYTTNGDSLWVTARTSEALAHPFAENWVGEPLRILLGQLIYPRLVARNFGDGKAQVWLRPSPKRYRNSAVASLVGGDPFESKPSFWTLYGKLLQFLVETHNKEVFEAHLITRLYEEIIQATQGSRWVLCFTLASVAEGLATLLMGPVPLRSDYSESDLKGLRDHVDAWVGDEELKSRILGAIRTAGTRTVGKFLRDLQRSAVLSSANIAAWSNLRNSVMHGNLVSPYSTREDDQNILDLADLVHRLTRAIIGVDDLRHQPTSGSGSIMPPQPAKSRGKAGDKRRG